MNHGKHVRNGNKDILAGFGIGTKADGRSPDDRANVVGLLNTILGVPRDVVLVGNVSRQDGCTVVTAETDEHKTVDCQTSKIGIRRYGPTQRGQP